jgi:hypothetical protein
MALANYHSKHMKHRTICTTCVAIFISFSFYLTCTQFTLFLQQLDSDLGNMNKMLLQLKLKTRCSKLIRIFHSAQKIVVLRFVNRDLCWCRGMPGASPSLWSWPSLDKSWFLSCLHPPVKKLHYKNFSHSFLWVFFISA